MDFIIGVLAFAAFCIAIGNMLKLGDLQGQIWELKFGSSDVNAKHHLYHHCPHGIKKKSEQNNTCYDCAMFGRCSVGH